MTEILIICLRYIIGVGALTVSGWSIVCAAEKIFSRDGKRFFTDKERWFLGFPLGSGLLAWYMFFLGVMGIPFGLTSIAPFFLLPIAIRIFLRKKQLQAPEKKDSILPMALLQKYVLIIAGALFALRLAFIVFEISVAPTYFEDSAAHWNQRAKILYHAKGFILDKDHPDFFGKYRPEYPPYTHLIKIYLSEAAGGWFEPVVNSSNVIILVSVLGFAYFVMVRLTGNSFISFIAMYVMGSIPLATYQMFGGVYSDFLFGLFVLAAFVLCMAWMRDPVRLGYLYISSFFFAASAFIKIEPLILVFLPVLFSLGMFARAKNLSWKKTLMPFVGVIMLYLGPWILLKAALGLPFLPSGGAPGGLFTPRLDLVPHMVRVLLFEGNYNIFFAAIGCMLIFIWRQLFSGTLKYGTLFVSLFFALILFAFLFTGSSQWLEDETTFHRTMIAFLPSSIFLLALASSEFLQSKRNN